MDPIVPILQALQSTDDTQGRILRKDSELVPSGSTSTREAEASRGRLQHILDSISKATEARQEMLQQMMGSLSAASGLPSMVSTFREDAEQLIREQEIDDSDPHNAEYLKMLQVTKEIRAQLDNSFMKLFRFILNQMSAKEEQEQQQQPDSSSSTREEKFQSQSAFLQDVLKEAEKGSKRLAAYMSAAVETAVVSFVQKSTETSPRESEPTAVNRRPAAARKSGKSVHKRNTKQPKVVKRSNNNTAVPSRRRKPWKVELTTEDDEEDYDDDQEEEEDEDEEENEEQDSGDSGAEQQAAFEFKRDMFRTQSKPSGHRAPEPKSAEPPAEMSLAESMTRASSSASVLSRRQYGSARNNLYPSSASRSETSTPTGAPVASSHRTSTTATTATASRNSRNSSSNNNNSNNKQQVPRKQSNNPSTAPPNTADSTRSSSLPLTHSSSSNSTMQPPPQDTNSNNSNSNNNRNSIHDDDDDRAAAATANSIAFAAVADTMSRTDSFASDRVLVHDTQPPPAAAHWKFHVDDVLLSTFSTDATPIVNRQFGHMESREQVSVATQSEQWKQQQAAMAEMFAQLEGTKQQLREALLQLKQMNSVDDNRSQLEYHIYQLENAFRALLWDLDRPESKDNYFRAGGGSDVEGMRVKYYFPPSSTPPHGEQVLLLLKTLIKEQRKLMQLQAEDNWQLMYKRVHFRIRYARLADANIPRSILHRLMQQWKDSLQVWTGRRTLFEQRRRKTLEGVLRALVHLTNWINQQPAARSKTNSDRRVRKPHEKSVVDQYDYLFKQMFTGPSILPIAEKVRLDSSAAAMLSPTNSPQPSKDMSISDLRRTHSQLHKDHLLRIRTILPWFPSDFPSFSVPLQEQTLCELCEFVLAGATSERVAPASPELESHYVQASVSTTSSQPPTVLPPSQQQPPPQTPQRFSPSSPTLLRRSQSTNMVPVLASDMKTFSRAAAATNKVFRSPFFSSSSNSAASSPLTTVAASTGVLPFRSNSSLGFTYSTTSSSSPTVKSTATAATATQQPAKPPRSASKTSINSGGSIGSSGGVGATRTTTGQQQQQQQQQQQGSRSRNVSFS